MRTCITFTLLFLCIVVNAQSKKDVPDNEIIEQLRNKSMKIETDRAVLWFKDSATDKGKAQQFANDITTGIIAIETFTGKSFEKEYYNAAKIEYFISDLTTVSHVYNGYHHNEGERLPFIFFSSKRFAQNSIPYLHETTHLILHEFHSLWLREGMAEWVAMKVAQQLGKGHTAFYGDDHAKDPHQLAAGIHTHEGKDVVMNLVGKNGIPAFKNTEIRRMFYIGSTSLVMYLAEQLTKEDLLALYFEKDTEQWLAQKLQQPVSDIKTAWLKHLPS